MAIVSELSSTARQFLEMFAPERCAECLKPGGWLCVDCERVPIRFDQMCIGCATPRARGTTCPQCKKDTPLSGVVSAGGYTNTRLQRLISWLKFRGIRDIASVLALHLTPHITSIAPLSYLQREAVLIPIPLHRRREKVRGFNQSYDIAQHLSEFLDVRIADCLVRDVSTWSQKKLPMDMRGSNVEGAFSLREALPSSPLFILVDDVTTSGSTLVEAARVLSDAGASSVWGATIARG